MHRLGRGDKIPKFYVCKYKTLFMSFSFNMELILVCFDLRTPDTTWLGKQLDKNLEPNTGSKKLPSKLFSYRTKST